MLKEYQWYRIPAGRWVQAGHIGDPHGPILMVYGVDLSDSRPFRNIYDMYVQPNGWFESPLSDDRWHIHDLIEATPDEAEHLVRRTLGLA